MFQFSIKKFALPAIIIAGLLATAAPVHAADTSNLSKDQIEQIVHDYLMAHGDVILNSVDTYQKKDVNDRQAAALKVNHDELFNNEKSPFIGNPKGDVTMIEFFDYNCHYCKDVFPTLKSLTENDKNLKIIFKDFPILAPSSETAAKWALAAQRQNKYFEFHQKMMEHKGPITDEDIEKVAKSVDLDLSAARTYVDSTDAMMQLERNRALAQQMAFNGTPSFVINDTAFSGVPDKEDLKTKIAEARKNDAAKTDDKAADDKPAGDKPADDKKADDKDSLTGKDDMKQ
ncbi:MAG: DsbA family protein [Micavibrio sp.]|nr:DsbA family protein [Micavibrio sp.]